MSADDPLTSLDRRGLRRLLRLKKSFGSSAKMNSLMSSSLPPPPSSLSGSKKNAFSSPAFCSLSCSSAASQVYAPSSAAAVAVRSSADWEGKFPRRRRTKQKKNKRGNLSPSSTTDVWCAPGISLVGDDSVDCVVSHRRMVGRGMRLDVQMPLRERAYYGRRDGNQEPASSMEDSLFSLQTSLSGSGFVPSEHYHHMRGYNHRPQVELDEIMLLHHRILLRGDAYDRYCDWRLDVDQMTYEELLELGDKIGHVSTGLRDEDIDRNIRKLKYSIYDKRFSTEMERKCSICQEEYETNDEVGKLGCGHSYHICCIKKWLLQKNACPVCKAAVSKT